MRILFINRFFHPDQSATAQLLTELAEDLDNSGVSVTVITGRTDYLGNGAALPARDLYKGIEIRRVRSTAWGNEGSRLGRLLDYLSFYAAAGWAALMSQKYDCLVVLSDPPLLSILAAVVGTVKRCHTMCWLQDVFPEIAVRAGVLPEGVTAGVFRRLAAWSLRRLDCIIVIGRCMRQHLQRLGIPGRKLFYSPNWADGSHIQPVNRDENWFGDDQDFNDRFVVMYSGNFGVVHEAETIASVLAMMKPVEPIRFCFIGKGLHRDALEQRAGAEGWDHVRFLPHQERERMRFALARADVHLVSLRSDMSGLSVPSKIYGIMAAGRPVIFIGPESSEAALVIKEAGCGYVIRPGQGASVSDAILQYYANPALRESHGRSARQYFEAHCERRIATSRFTHALFELK
jgi:glycosyltransferase involved in cell wall biosynthesis